MEDQLTTGGPKALSVSYLPLRWLTALIRGGFEMLI
jgi:hypothetical protein